MENNGKNSDYDLVLIIIASRSYIYDKIIICYWLPFINYIEKNKCKVKIYLAFGRDVEIGDLGIPRGNTFTANIDESLIPGILIKTIDAMKFIDDNYNYKHILRSNLGSFFILENLLKVCKSLSDEDTYASHKGSDRFLEPGVNFAHGCGFWMSADVVSEVIENRESINNDLPDDIAISMLLEDRNIQPLLRFDMTHNIIINNELFVPVQKTTGQLQEGGESVSLIKVFKIINNYHKEELLKYIMSLNHYHIRIKNSDRTLRDGTYASDIEETDIDLMKCFTDKLYANSPQPESKSPIYESPIHHTKKKIPRSQHTFSFMRNKGER
jgi:hypothetical protein